MPVKLPTSFLEKTWTHKKGMNHEIKGAILAAGLGKRMDPLTAHHLPKPLFPLGGKVPILEIWIRRFVGSGISDISMNLCVLKDTIKRYFKDGSKFATNINYVEEDIPTGTLGGACKQVLGNKSKKTLKDEEIPKADEFKGSIAVVPSGDIVTNFGTEFLEEMYDIHKKAGAAFSMVLTPVPWERRKDFGTVILDKPEERKGGISKSGAIIDFIEKDPNSPSNLNNASIYMIEKELLKILDEFRTEATTDLDHPFYDFGKHVFPAMLNKLPHIKLPRDFVLWGIQYDGGWFDVGNKRDYLRVNESLLDGKIKVWLPYEKLPWGYLGHNVAINFSNVTIIPPVVIGNNCIIEQGVKLGPYAIIGDDWIIERNASIKHSVLWERYSYFDKDGNEMPADERRLIDRHEVRRDVSIEECVIAGGIIQSNIREKTVDVLEDGNTEILPIDYVPAGPRA